MPLPRKDPSAPLPRRKTAPSKRGFPSVTLSSADDMERLNHLRGAAFDGKRWTGGISLGAMVSRLLDAYEQPQGVPAPAAPSIPWDAIREALLDEFGFIAHDKVDRALQAVKEALPG